MTLKPNPRTLVAPTGALLPLSAERTGCELGLLAAGPAATREEPTWHKAQKGSRAGVGRGMLVSEDITSPWGPDVPKASQPWTGNQYFCLLAFLGVYTSLR